MTYEIDAKFIIITNNRKLIKNQTKRQDSHYTIKAMLGSILDLSICGAEKLNQNTITTLLIPREKHDQYQDSLKTGREVCVTGTVVMHSKGFHPVYIKEIKEQNCKPRFR